MRVVIVGGGFGGVKAALSLANKKNIDVKLKEFNDYLKGDNFLAILNKLVP